MFNCNTPIKQGHNKPMHFYLIFIQSSISNEILENSFNSGIHRLNQVLKKIKVLTY